MPEIIQNSIDYFLKVRETSGDILEPFLPWLIFVSLVLSALLVLGIIYCLVNSGYLKYKADEFSDTIGIGHVGKRRQLRAWKKITKRLKTEKMEQWKIAILEADAIFDEILKMGGYRGNDVHERFQQFSPTAISNYDKIIAAHNIRDRIRQEPDFILNKQDAAMIISFYQQAFKELGMLG